MHILTFMISLKSDAIKRFPQVSTPAFQSPAAFVNVSKKSVMQLDRELLCRRPCWSALFKLWSNKQVVNLHFIIISLIQGPTGIRFVMCLSWFLSRGFLNWCGGSSVLLIGGY